MALLMTTILTTPNMLTASATEITLAALGLNTFLTMWRWNKMNPLYMLDTNIISDIFKLFPNQNVFIFSKIIDDIYANFPIIQYDNHSHRNFCYSSSSHFLRFFLIMPPSFDSGSSSNVKSSFGKLSFIKRKARYSLSLVSSELRRYET